MLSKLPGTDITNVIDTLSDDELTAIAREISHIFKQLREIPNNGRFGDKLGDDSKLLESWTDCMEELVNNAKERGLQTGVMDGDLESLLNEVFDRYRDYFNHVEATTYFDDMSSKNVMVHEGEFSGLVDLDALAQGDPLETIGRIKASWYGTRHGEAYTNAVMDAEVLSPEQRKIVTVYALLNRISWSCENGIQFNQNTSGTVDWDKAETDKRIVKELAEELEKS